MDPVGATIGANVGQIVTAPAGGGGLDASLLLAEEQLRPENRYDRCRSPGRRPVKALQLLLCTCLDWRGQNQCASLQQ